MGIPSGRTADGRVRRQLAKTHPNPLETAALRRLTRRFLTARAQLLEDSVLGVVRLGRILEEGRRAAGRSYLDWLRQLGISKTTALHWRAAYRLTRRRPGVLREWRNAGATKLYRVARLSRTTVSRLATKAERGGFAGMSKQQFIAFTAPHVRVMRKSSPGRRGHGAIMKLDSFISQVGAFDFTGLDDDLLRVKLLQRLRRLEALAKKTAKTLKRRRTG